MRLNKCGSLVDSQIELPNTKGRICWILRPGEVLLLFPASIAILLEHRHEKAFALTAELTQKHRCQANLVHLHNHRLPQIGKEIEHQLLILCLRIYLWKAPNDKGVLFKTERTGAFHSRFICHSLCLQMEIWKDRFSNTIYTRNDEEHFKPWYFLLIYQVVVCQKRNSVLETCIENRGVHISLLGLALLSHQYILQIGPNSTHHNIAFRKFYSELLAVQQRENNKHLRTSNDAFGRDMGHSEGHETAGVTQQPVCALQLYNPEYYLTSISLYSSRDEHKIALYQTVIFHWKQNKRWICPIEGHGL